MIITAGKTNVTVDVYFVDDDGGTAPGEPTTGKLFSDIETGGSASYHRQGAARVDFTLVTQTAAGAHTDGGFVLIDDTNMPGLYRLDVPDAAFATGVDYVVIQCVMAAANNSIMRPLLIDLTDVDLRDSVRGGMTALPNAAADAAGGLPISDAGALDLDTKLANTNEITVARMGALTDWINGGRLDLILDIIAADTTTDIPALIGTPAGASIAADLLVIDNFVDGLEATIGVAGAGLTDLGGMSTGMKAEVLVEINAALDTAISELSQGVPTATPTLRTGLMLMYMALRNKTDVQTSGTDALEIHNDAGTQIAVKLLTDDGADYAEAKMTTGV